MTIRLKVELRYPQAGGGRMVTESPQQGRLFGVYATDYGTNFPGY
jgi:hypothetical protein